MVLHEPATPPWWLQRLHRQIIDRTPEIQRYDDYYRGDHRTPWLAPDAQREFRRLLDMTRSNYMGLVVDATVERMQIEGFRVSSEQTEPDREMWRIWQANGMDAESDEAFSAAGIRGRSFMLVAPNRDDASTPHIWVEDALQAAVQYLPGSNMRVRAAGLKVWCDDWTGKLQATLYTPGALYKYETRNAVGPGSFVTADSVEWLPREVPGETWPAANPLGVVPLIELPNMNKAGQSELYDVIPIQDRINKTLADRMMSQDFGAFPQRWATGYPDEDAQGNPAAPIDIGRDRMVTTDVPETKFGQWDAAPLDPFSAAKSEDVNDIAARTRTPPQYLLGRMANLPGEALQAAEVGLIAKAKRRMRVLDDRIEDVARLARLAAGMPAQGTEVMQIVWKNPEYRSEGETVDALVKMRTLGVPYEALWERWGAGPTERERWKRMLDEESVDPLLAQFQASSQVPPAAA